jgi:hypothetical protein
MTRDEVRFVLARVAAIWGRKPAAPVVVDEWFNALAEYPAGRVHTTLDQLVRQGADGPNLAQFVALVRANAPRGFTPPAPEWGGPDDAGRRAIARIRAEHGWTSPA